MATKRATRTASVKRPSKRSVKTRSKATRTDTTLGGVRAKKPSTSPSTARLMKLYAGQSRADLLRMLIDPEGDSVDHILGYTRLPRAALILEVERRRAAAVRTSRERCPRGCSPDDPNCDLTHWLVMIEPDLPFRMMLSRPPKKATGTYHEWVTDELRPVNTKSATLFEMFAIPEHQIGWWWRKPWGWLLNLWRRCDRGRAELVAYVQQRTGLRS